MKSFTELLKEALVKKDVTISELTTRNTKLETNKHYYKAIIVLLILLLCFTKITITT